MNIEDRYANKTNSFYVNYGPSGHLVDKAGVRAFKDYQTSATSEFTLGKYKYQMKSVIVFSCFSLRTWVKPVNYINKSKQKTIPSKTMFPPRI